MDKVQRQLQEEIDRYLLSFVRRFQSLAPVTEENAAAFIRNQCGLRVTICDVRDRLAYLVSAGDLETKAVWEDGTEIEQYKITAAGMDREDGKLPPRNWKANKG